MSFSASSVMHELVLTASIYPHFSPIYREKLRSQYSLDPWVSAAWSLHGSHFGEPQWRSTLRTMPVPPFRQPSASHVLKLWHLAKSLGIFACKLFTWIQGIFSPNSRRPCRAFCLWRLPRLVARQLSWYSESASLSIRRLSQGHIILASSQRSQFIKIDRHKCLFHSVFIKMPTSCIRHELRVNGRRLLNLLINLIYCMILLISTDCRTARSAQSYPMTISCSQRERCLQSPLRQQALSLTQLYQYGDN